MEEGSLKRVAGSGRRATIATQENVLKIAELFDKKSGISQRSVANMFNCHRTTINKILNQKTMVRNRKKKKRPLRTPAQRKLMRPKCRKLAEKC